MSVAVMVGTGVGAVVAVLGQQIWMVSRLTDVVNYVANMQEIQTARQTEMLRGVVCDPGVCAYRNQKIGATDGEITEKLPVIESDDDASWRELSKLRIGAYVSVFIVLLSGVLYAAQHIKGAN